MRDNNYKHYKELMNLGIMKQCSKCKKVKSLNEFGSDKRVKSGKKARCQICASVASKASKDKNRAYYLQYWKDYDEGRKVIKSERDKVYRKEHPEINKKARHNYYKTHPEVSRRSRLLRLQRIPLWADLEKINKFYIECPDGYTVDHIIPLSGKFVSGFHVDYNLQYLTRSENSKKNNIFIPGSYFDKF
jgi:hypothetical protein